MAFVSAVSTSEPRSFSIGPVKVEFHTFTSADDDVAGTVTAVALSEVFHIIIGLELDEAPTYAANVVTLSFTDKGGAVDGDLILIGR